MKRIMRNSSIACLAISCLLAIKGGRLAIAQTVVEQSKPNTAGQKAENLPADINAKFLSPEMDPATFVGQFEVESREVFVCRQQILNAMELTSGDKVADIGAGTGLFLKPLSEDVGSDGKVFAVDISPNFVKFLKQRSKKEQLENVEVIFCSERSANLPPSSVDCLLICDVYHHFEYPQDSLESLLQALRPGGRLVLVDFFKKPKGVSPSRLDWLDRHIRAEKDVFRKEIEAAGFKFLDELPVEGFKENYLLRFSKEVP
jgi:ubiquinone/menaquinone biosynthesis C-methylase UbiE